MSYAKLNIWLRYADCSLITDCWRTDLVINSCCGESVVDQDPTIIDQLKERYPDYQAVEAHFYQGEKRIKLQPGPGAEGHIYHIEVDVPPGCYVVWTRVCHGKNEETNKVMVIVSCGDEACVNLILNAVERCVREVFHPLLVRAVDLKKQKPELQGAAKMMMDVAGIPKKEVIAELGQRLEEAKEMKDMQLQKAISSILDATKGIPGPQQQQQQK